MPEGYTVDDIATDSLKDSSSSNLSTATLDGEILNKWTTSNYSEDKEKGTKKRRHGIIKIRPRAKGDSNFKNFVYTFATLYVLSCSFVSLGQPLLVDCVQPIAPKRPAYPFGRTCHDHRYMKLAFLTPRECAFGRRIVIATLLGVFIGWERQQADRPVGIKLMALASLGSCLLTICGVFAFVEGPFMWDASRISAAIPKGVGFLGAGIIWKQVRKDTSMQQIYHLTTSASLWLSSAVGIACAGELYFPAGFSVAVMTVLLQFGPRSIYGEINV